MTDGPVGTRCCSFACELLHPAAYKACDRLAALQVPQAVLAMIIEALRPAGQPVFRLVCSSWHQSLEIKHKVHLIPGSPELTENRISTIRQLLPKATVNMITAGCLENELQRVDIVTVHHRLKLYAGKPPHPSLGKCRIWMNQPSWSRAGVEHTSCLSRLSTFCYNCCLQRGSQSHHGAFGGPKRVERSGFGYGATD